MKAAVIVSDGDYTHSAGLIQSINVIGRATGVGDMTVDSPALLSQFLQQVVQQLGERRQQALSTVAMEAAIRAERSVWGLVRQVAAPTPAQIEILSGEISRRAVDEPALRNLLNTSRLLLAELEVEGQTRLILTDQTLRKNTSVTLIVGPGERLRLAPRTQTNPPIEARLSAALRDILPKQSRSHLYPLLDTIKDAPPGEKSLTALPALPARLMQVLARMQPKSPEILKNPAQLRQAIRDSGVFLEAKLARAASSHSSPPAPVTQQPTKSLTAATPDTRGNDAAVRQFVLSKAAPLAPRAASYPKAEPTLAARQHRSDSDALRPPSRPDPKLFRDLQGDIKANLLQAKIEIEAMLAPKPNDSVPIPSAPIVGRELSTRDFTAALKQFLAAARDDVPASPSRRQSDARTQNRQVLQVLQQQVNTALARIQLQQVQSLLQSHAPAETHTATPNPVLQFDIPVRTDLGVQFVQVRIEEDEQGSGGDDATAAKIKQWQVTLSFDLPQAGALFAKVQLRGDSVDIRFWAERADTLAEAEGKLHQLRSELERQGIKVGSLDCLAGQPLQTKVSLSYALVDVVT